MVIKLSDLDEKNLEKLAKEKGIDVTGMMVHLIHVFMAAEAGKRSNYMYVIRDGDYIIGPGSPR